MKNDTEQNIFFFRQSTDCAIKIIIVIQSERQVTKKENIQREGERCFGSNNKEEKRDKKKKR
jgi:hypothetical protein